jgi:hypothetical protein
MIRLTPSPQGRRRVRKKAKAAATVHDCLGADAELATDLGVGPARRVKGAELVDNLLCEYKPLSTDAEIPRLLGDHLPVPPETRGKFANRERIVPSVMPPDRINLCTSKRAPIH